MVIGITMVATVMTIKTTMIKIIMVMKIVIMMMAIINCRYHYTLIHGWFVDLGFG